MSDPTTRIPGLTISLGATISKKYRVDRVIGEGAMGVVVAATHLQLGQLVALKFLRGARATDGEAVARFVREAKSAARIQSEHVVRVLDIDALPDRTPFMVMEFVEGKDLAHVLAERGRLPVGEAIDYLLQACEAIAEAHVAGIVHRDLKPSNLLLAKRADGSRSVKVLDFGVSKLIRGCAGDYLMTSATATMGTPLYMAPEQMKSARNVDARADVWALGAILRELITGGPLFFGETVPEICAQLLSSERAPPMPESATISAELEAIVQRCLEKDWHRRFADVAELALALGPLAPERARLSIRRIVRIIRGASAAAMAPPSAGARAALVLVGDDNEDTALWSRDPGRGAGIPSPARSVSSMIVTPASGFLAPEVRPAGVSARFRRRHMVVAAVALVAATSGFFVTFRSPASPPPEVLTFEQVVLPQPQVPAPDPVVPPAVPLPGALPASGRAAVVPTGPLPHPVVPMRRLAAPARRNEPARLVPSAGVSDGTAAASVVPTLSAAPSPPPDPVEELPAEESDPYGGRK